jgi:hypothetical protein
MLFYVQPKIEQQMREGRSFKEAFEDLTAQEYIHLDEEIDFILSRIWQKIKKVLRIK